jgi:hypothetical protein
MKRTMLTTAVLAFALGGCAQGLTIGPSQADVTVQVPGTPETAMRVATAQLTSHGFMVGGTSGGTNGNSVVTTPKLVESDMMPADVTGPQLWVLQVSAAPSNGIGGTTVRVAGYRVPATPNTAAGASAGQAGVPITAADRKLFDQVRNAAKWIRDADRG